MMCGMNPPVSNPTFVEALGHVRSDRRIDILRQIGELGSISKAARAVGVSYKAAWQAVDTLTNLAGVALLDRAVGGRGGGGALLTDAGRQLLIAADALKSARVEAVQQMHEQAAPQAETAARLAVRTSMRNQWPCVVTEVEVAGQIARVHLESLADRDFRVCARITRESLELLAIHKGIRVQALCKATAVSVKPFSDSSGQTGVNGWQGVAARISRGALGDEVATTLGTHLQVVGFTQPGVALRSRSKVLVEVAEAAIVLAIDGA